MIHSENSPHFHYDNSSFKSTLRQKITSLLVRIVNFAYCCTHVYTRRQQLTLSSRIAPWCYLVDEVSLFDCHLLIMLQPTNIGVFHTFQNLTTRLHTEDILPFKLIYPVCHICTLLTYIISSYHLLRISTTWTDRLITLL